MLNVSEVIFISHLRDKQRRNQAMAQYGDNDGEWCYKANLFNNGAAKGSPLNGYRKVTVLQEQGRKKPIFCFNSRGKGSYDSVTEYERGLPRRVVEDQFSSPGGVEFNINRSHVDRWGGRPSSLVPDCPYRVKEFITSIQPEMSEPTSRTPVSATNWPPPYSSNHNGVTGYGEYTVDDYYDSKEPELAMTLTSRWDRSKYGGLPDTSFTKPTSDIGAAVENLKEAAMPERRIRFETLA